MTDKLIILSREFRHLESGKMTIRTQRPNNIAFTLMELMIVVILVGMVAMFGIPKYTKAVNRAKEKDAVTNLGLILEAVRLHMSRTGGVPPPDLADVNEINSTLYLNILRQEGNTYQCVNANIYTCHATNADGWRVELRLDTNNGAIFCSPAPFSACPTL